MTIEELSRVSQAMAIQSDLLCFFLPTFTFLEVGNIATEYPRM
jgi:hypothetical protein